jgi:hypothetical protein
VRAALQWTPVAAGVAWCGGVLLRARRRKQRRRLSQQEVMNGEAGRAPTDPIYPHRITKPGPGPALPSRGFSRRPPKKEQS